MLTPEQLSDLFKQNYTALLGDLRNLADAEEQAGSARLALTAARQAVLIKYADDSRPLGPNEAARAAKLDELCAVELTELRRLEGLVTTAKHLVEQRNVLIANARAQLRCAELAARIDREGE